jgi:hypothetical protein
MDTLQNKEIKMNSEKDLLIRVVVDVRRKYKYDGPIARSEIDLSIQETSLPGMVGAIDALIHSMTVEVSAEAMENLKIEKEKEASE